MALTIDGAVSLRLTQILLLLLGFHGTPGTVLHELDLITVRARVQDLHEEAAEGRKQGNSGS